MKRPPLLLWCLLKELLKGHLLSITISSMHATEHFPKRDSFHSSSRLLSQDRPSQLVPPPTDSEIKWRWPTFELVRFSLCTLMHQRIERKHFFQKKCSKFKSVKRTYPCSQLYFVPTLTSSLLRKVAHSTRRVVEGPLFLSKKLAQLLWMSHMCSWCTSLPTHIIGQESSHHESITMLVSSFQGEKFLLHPIWC